MRAILPKPEHEAFYQDFVALLNKHAGHLPADETLALAAQSVGALIAYQDQRKYTTASLMEMVRQNIEAGNARHVAQLMNLQPGTPN